MLDTIWSIAQSIQAHFQYQHCRVLTCTSLSAKRKAQLHKLLFITRKYRMAATADRPQRATLSPAPVQPQPETPPPAKQSTLPTTPWLTLSEFFQHLWNLSPATPQVSLPSILGLTELVTTLTQCTWPRIRPPTIRSGTWSLVSYGLQWLIALHAKAIASAWDLITQTHLELRSQVNAGKSHCGSAEELFRSLALSLSSPCFSQICYLPPHTHDYDRLSFRMTITWSGFRSILTNQIHSTTQLRL
jgi:hypothetical protein